MNITDCLHPGKRIFMIGIGGVSMCALAEVLQQSGVQISGYDRQESSATRRLTELGIVVTTSEEPESLNGAEAVIRTAAARDDHPLVTEARRRGLPVFERAEGWGALSAGYTHSVCLAGTHGKTTTTGMFSHIALEAGDPTIMLGGTLPILGAGHRMGHGNMIVLESCEYTNSYHHFNPTVAVVLNVEEDHLDFFRDMDDILDSFSMFCARIPDHGHIVLNADDPGCQQLAQRLPEGLAELVHWFGLGHQAGVTAMNLQNQKGLYSFDVYTSGTFYAHIELKVPGLHNVSNALAAAAAAYVTGIPGGLAAKGLSAFGGTGRRMERLGECNGIPVYDDYAHHPTEIAAAVKALRGMEPERILLVFQPHTYTRTKALFGDFVTTLSAVDCCFLAEIYAAREVNADNLSSAQLAKKIPGAVFARDFESLAQAVKAQARPGDVICTMGAGDIRALAERYLLRR